jgi:intracellular multiplication protein IcmT
MAWRDTMRPVRLLGVDARVVLPLALFLGHIRWWTFGLAIFLVFCLVILERRGLSVPAAGRWLRALLAGRHRPGRPWWRKRFPSSHP